MEPPASSFRLKEHDKHKKKYYGCRETLDCGKDPERSNRSKENSLKNIGFTRADRTVETIALNEQIGCRGKWRNVSDTS
jgi:hypothetical protein